jgi:hypothetical protein
MTLSVNRDRDGRWSFANEGGACDASGTIPVVETRVIHVPDGSWLEYADMRATTLGVDYGGGDGWIRHATAGELVQVADNRLWDGVWTAAVIV